jgi:hypothetical protein
VADAAALTAPEAPDVSDNQFPWPAEAVALYFSVPAPMLVIVTEPLAGELDCVSTKRAASGDAFSEGVVGIAAVTVRVTETVMVAANRDAIETVPL